MYIFIFFFNNSTYYNFYLFARDVISTIKYL